MKFQARQGDVFLQRVKVLPQGATPVEDDAGRFVLAYGEVTGHAHAIKVGPNVRLLAVPGLDDRFLEIGGEGAVVEHEEHAPIPLAPGIYQVRRQREYAPEAIRYVAD